MLQELYDAINRLDNALKEKEFEDAISNLGDVLDRLEGIIPGFVNPLISQD